MVIDFPCMMEILGEAMAEMERFFSSGLSAFPTFPHATARTVVAVSWQLSYSAPHYHMGKVMRQFVVAIIESIFQFSDYRW